MSKKESSPKSALSGKTALVTGATTGIGFALADGLAKSGAKVFITGRNSKNLKAAATKLAPYKNQIFPVLCDVRDPLQVNDLATAMRDKFGQLDILINNAGVAHNNHKIAELPLHMWQEVIDTNLTGMFLVTQAGLPLMKRGGTIVNTLSVASKSIFEGWAGYCASKFGALGFTNTLREEVRPQGIRVIAAFPGATDTEIWKDLWPDAPRPKMMSSDTVASIVLHAVSLPENSTVEEIVIRPTVGRL